MSSTTFWFAWIRIQLHVAKTAGMDCRMNRSTRKTYQFKEGQDLSRTQGDAIISCNRTICWREQKVFGK